MTRTEIACRFMAVVLADPNAGGTIRKLAVAQGVNFEDAIAGTAVLLADALLKALEKPL